MQSCRSQLRVTLRASVGVCLLSVAALLVPACGPANPVAEPTDQVLVADTGGPISTWFLQIGDQSPPEFLQTQAALVAATPASVQFRISVGDESSREAFLHELRRRGVDAEERVTTLQTTGRHYPWLRDLFVAGVAEDGAPVALMHQPVHLGALEGASSHAHTLGIVEALKAGRVVQTPLRLEGGSVVADRERAFVSRTNAELAVRKGQYANVAEFELAAREQWGRTVTLISTADADRAEHLDLLMMPIGERRIIISNPALALRLMHGLRAQDLARFRQDARAIASQAQKTNGIRNLLRVDVVEALRAENSDPRRQWAFDQIRRELQAAGYELIDVPFLSSDPARSGARVALSYTNVVQDERGGIPTVYMPTYRLPALDDHAVATWKRCGFRVVRIDAFGPGLNGGGVRCLSQVIRGPHAPAIDDSVPYPTTPQSRLR